MARNLDLDPARVDEAVAVGGRRTKKEAVTEALREYIARRLARGTSCPTDFQTVCPGDVR
jgi:hypothetical protein